MRYEKHLLNGGHLVRWVAVGDDQDEDSEPAAAIAPAPAASAPAPAATVAPVAIADAAEVRSVRHRLDGLAITRPAKVPVLRRKETRRRPTRRRWRPARGKNRGSRIEPGDGSPV